MAEFPDVAKRQLGFFHGLSKVPTEATQQVYESKYKSAHSVKSNEIWSDTIAYAVDVAAADIEASTNLAVTKYNLQSLTEIAGSNGQSWYLDNAGTFVRPFISPVDIPNTITNNPSDGYQGLLYQSDNTIITPTEGSWVFDYYAGIIKFAEGFTPSDMGWGIPKISCYVYTGATGGGGGSVGSNNGAVEEFNLTSTNITNKYITLSDTPTNSSKILIFINGGLKGQLNSDYHIVGNQINWNGDLWDGVLTSTDILTVLYWYNSGSPSTDVEDVEEFSLSSSDVTNKYITLSNTPILSKILIFINGGLKGRLNNDYHIVGNQINWNGDLWDGVLTSTDILTVLYWY